MMLYRMRSVLTTWLAKEPVLKVDFIFEPAVCSLRSSDRFCSRNTARTIDSSLLRPRSFDYDTGNRYAYICTPENIMRPLILPCPYMVLSFSRDMPGGRIHLDQ